MRILKQRAWFQYRVLIEFVHKYWNQILKKNKNIETTVDENIDTNIDQNIETNIETNIEANIETVNFETNIEANIETNIVVNIACTLSFKFVASVCCDWPATDWQRHWG